MTDATSAPAGLSGAADAAAAVATFLRLADAAEAALLGRLAAAAIGRAEAFLGHVLVARGAEDVVAADGGWHRLAIEPVRGIAGVTALPPDVAPFVLPVDRYRIDVAADGRGWVRVAPSAVGDATRAAVSYTAGLAADWASLPAPIAEGVVALAARLFTDRDAGTAPPSDVIAAWRPFRRLRLAGGGR